MSTSNLCQGGFLLTNKLLSSKIVETLAGENEPDILDDFLATFSHQVANCIGREKVICK